MNSPAADTTYAFESCHAPPGPGTPRGGTVPHPPLTMWSTAGGNSAPGRKAARAWACASALPRPQTAATPTRAPAPPRRITSAISAAAAHRAPEAYQTTS